MTVVTVFVLLFGQRNGKAGGFSEEGITPGGIIYNNTLSCFSNHLTSFAVLVDATGYNVMIIF